MSLEERLLKINRQIQKDSNRNCRNKNIIIAMKNNELVKQHIK